MREYTKADLVEFAKWNSNAPVSVLNKASVEELEAFIKRGNAWDRFLESLSQYRECRQLEKASRQFKKALGIIGRC